MQPLVGLLPGQAIDRHLEVAFEQPLLEKGRARIDDLELYPGMTRLQAADQVEQIGPAEWCT